MSWMQPPRNVSLDDFYWWDSVTHSSPSKGMETVPSPALGNEWCSPPPAAKVQVFSHSRKERNQCRKACECQVRNLPVKVPPLWREVVRAKGKIGGGLGCRRAAPRRQGGKDAEFLRKRQSGTVSS